MPSCASASACLTWVGRGRRTRQALAARLGRLQQVAEGWGEAVFTPLTGDPLESLAASVPGFCCGATAQPALVPLAETLRVFPVSRPAALSRSRRPRAGGAHLFRSPDGKPLPLAADEGGDYGFELIYGLPGQGKSVLMNALGLAFCLQGGQTRLPLAAVIDIGPSSSGLVSLVREALPAERRHEAGWFPLRMTSEHAINPCDTQLGCRSPLPAERAFLTNLLGLMVTPAGDAGVPDGMRELLGPTLTGAYAMRSDTVAGAEPHDYTEGRDEDVDAAIAEAGLRLPETPLWWDVVDLLFEAGEIEAASRAQRYAVPTLVDLLASVREPIVQGLVGDARYGSGGETVTQAFIRILTALSGDWPVMFAPTAFDVGGARLAAIDLAEVAPQGSAEADRQAAAFYLLARHALTRHWWIGEDALGAIPEPYREWHAARLRDIRESPKRLCYDEFHRTAGAPAVRAQVERDVREARKLRGAARAGLPALGGFRGRARRARQPLLDPGKRRQGEGSRGARRHVLPHGHALGRDPLPAHRPRPRRRAGTVDRERSGRALRAASGQHAGAGRALGAHHQPGGRRAQAAGPCAAAPAQARAALARAFPEGTARSRIERELARMDSPEAGRAASEEAVLDRLAEEVSRAAGNEPPHSADNAT